MRSLRKKKEQKENTLYLRMYVRQVQFMRWFLPHPLVLTPHIMAQDEEQQQKMFAQMEERLRKITTGGDKDIRRNPTFYPYSTPVDFRSSEKTHEFSPERIEAIYAGLVAKDVLPLSEYQQYIALQEKEGLGSARAFAAQKQKEAYEALPPGQQNLVSDQDYQQRLDTILSKHQESQRLVQAEPSQSAGESRATLESLYHMASGLADVTQGQHPMVAALQNPEFYHHFQEGNFSPEFLTRVWQMLDVKQAGKGRTQKGDEAEIERLIFLANQEGSTQSGTVEHGAISDMPLAPSWQEHTANEEQFRVAHGGKSAYDILSEEWAAKLHTSVAKIRDAIPNLSDEQVSIIRGQEIGKRGMDDQVHQLLFGAPGGGKTDVYAALMMELAANGVDMRDVELISPTHSGQEAIAQRLEKIREFFPQGYMEPSTLNSLIYQKLFKPGGTEVGGKKMKVMEALNMGDVSPSILTPEGNQDFASIEEMERGKSGSANTFLASVFKKQGLEPTPKQIIDILSSIGETKADWRDYNFRLKAGAELFSGGWIDRAKAHPGEEEFHQIPDDLGLFLYEKAKQGVKGFEVDDGQKRRIDQEDMVKIFGVAAKNNLIENPKYAFVDEAQDFNENQAEAFSHYTQDSSVFLSGDPSQAIIQRRSLPHEFFPEWFPGIKQSTLTQNYRMNATDMALVNAIGQDARLKGMGVSPLQTSRKGMGQTPVFHVSENFATMNRARVSSMFSQMGLSIPEVLANIRAKRGTFEGYTVSPKQIPAISQTRRARSEFRLALLDALQQEGKLEPKQAERALNYIYSDKTPKKDDPEVFYNLTIQQARSRSFQMPHADVTTMGKWKIAGYLSNLYTMLSRSSERNFIFGAQFTDENDLKKHGMTRTPERIGNTIVPYGFGSLLKRAGQNLLDQGYTQEQLPEVYQQALSAKIEQVRAKSLVSGTVPLRRFLDMVMGYSRYFVPTATNAPSLQSISGEEGVAYTPTDEEKPGELAGLVMHKDMSAANLSGQHGRSLARPMGEFLSYLRTVVAQGLPGGSQMLKNLLQTRDKQGTLQKGFDLNTVEDIAKAAKLFDAREGLSDEEKAEINQQAGFDPRLEDRAREEKASREKSEAMQQDRRKLWEGFYQGKDEAKLSDVLYSFSKSALARHMPLMQSLLAGHFTSPEFEAHLMTRKNLPEDFAKSYWAFAGKGEEGWMAQAKEAHEREKARRTAYEDQKARYKSGKMSESEATAFSKLRAPEGSIDNFDAFQEQYLKQGKQTRISSLLRQPGQERLQDEMMQYAQRFITGRDIQQLMRPENLKHMSSFLEEQGYDELATYLRTANDMLGNGVTVTQEHLDWLQHSNPLEFEKLKRWGFEEGTNVEQHLGGGSLAPEILVTDVTQKVAEGEKPKRSDIATATMNFERSLGEKGGENLLEKMGMPLYMSALAPVKGQFSVLQNLLEKTGIVDPQAGQMVSDEFYPEGTGVALSAYQKRLQEQLAHPYFRQFRNEKGDWSDARAQELYRELEDRYAALPPTPEGEEPSKERNALDRHLIALQERQSAVEQAKNLQRQLGMTQQAMKLYDPENQLNWAHMANIAMRASQGESATKGLELTPDNARDFFSHVVGGFGDNTRTLENMAGLSTAFERATNYTQKTGNLRRGDVTSILEALGHPTDDSHNEMLKQLGISAGFNRPESEIPLSKLTQGDDILTSYMTRAPLLPDRFYRFAGGQEGYTPLLPGQEGIKSGMHGFLLPYEGVTSKGKPVKPPFGRPVYGAILGDKNIDMLTPDEQKLSYDQKGRNLDTLFRYIVEDKKAKGGFREFAVRGSQLAPDSVKRGFRARPANSPREPQERYGKAPVGDPGHVRSFLQSPRALQERYMKVMHPDGVSAVPDWIESNDKMVEGVGRVPVSSWERQQWLEGKEKEYIGKADKVTPNPELFKEREKRNQIIDQLKSTPSKLVHPSLHSHFSQNRVEGNVPKRNLFASTPPQTTTRQELARQFGSSIERSREMEPSNAFDWQHDADGETNPRFQKPLIGPQQEPSLDSMMDMEPEAKQGRLARARASVKFKPLNAIQDKPLIPYADPEAYRWAQSQGMLPKRTFVPDVRYQQSLSTAREAMNKRVSTEGSLPKLSDPVTQMSLFPEIRPNVTRYNHDWDTYSQFWKQGGVSTQMSPDIAASLEHKYGANQQMRDWYFRTLNQDGPHLSDMWQGHDLSRWGYDWDREKELNMLAQAGGEQALDPQVQYLANRFGTQPKEEQIAPPTASKPLAIPDPSQYWLDELASQHEEAPVPAPPGVRAGASYPASRVEDIFSRMKEGQADVRRPSSGIASEIGANLAEQARVARLVPSEMITEDVFTPPLLLPQQAASLQFGTNFQQSALSDRHLNDLDAPFGRTYTPPSVIQASQLALPSGNLPLLLPQLAHSLVPPLSGQPVTTRLPYESPDLRKNFPDEVYDSPPAQNFSQSTKRGIFGAIDAVRAGNFPKDPVPVPTPTSSPIEDPWGDEPTRLPYRAPVLNKNVPEGLSPFERTHLERVALQQGALPEKKPSRLEQAYEDMLKGNTGKGIFAPNVEQQQAIGSEAQHLWIEGGPGGGKTDTMARSVMRWMLRDQVDPKAILSLSGLKSGGAAMKKAYGEYLGKIGAKEKGLIPDPRTFHSLAHKILFQQDEAGSYPLLEAMGLGHVKGILADKSDKELAELPDDQKKNQLTPLFRQYLQGVTSGIDTSDETMKGFLSQVQKLKSQGMGDQSRYALDLALGQKYLQKGAKLGALDRPENLPLGLAHYEEFYKGQEALDFPGLIHWAGEATEQFPREMMPLLVQRAQGIAVDEAQDVTPGFMRLLRGVFQHMNPNSRRSIMSMDVGQSALEGFGGIAPNDIRPAYQKMFADVGGSLENVTLRENRRSSFSDVMLINSILGQDDLKNEAKSPFQRPAPNAPLGQFPDFQTFLSQTDQNKAIFQTMQEKTGIDWSVVRKNLDAHNATYKDGDEGYMFPGVSTLFKDMPWKRKPGQVPLISPTRSELDLFQHDLPGMLPHGLFSEDERKNIAKEMFRIDAPGVGEKEFAHQEAEIQHWGLTDLGSRSQTFDEAVKIYTRHGTPNEHNEGWSPAQWLRNTMIGLSRTRFGTKLFGGDRYLTAAQTKKYTEQGHTIGVVKNANPMMEKTTYLDPPGWKAGDKPGQMIYRRQDKKQGPFYGSQVMNIGNQDDTHPDAYFIPQYMEKPLKDYTAGMLQSGRVGAKDEFFPKGVREHFVPQVMREYKLENIPDMVSGTPHGPVGTPPDPTGGGNTGTQPGPVISQVASSPTSPSPVSTSSPPPMPGGPLVQNPAQGSSTFASNSQQPPSSMGSPMPGGPLVQPPSGSSYTTEPIPSILLPPSSSGGPFQLSTSEQHDFAARGLRSMSNDLNFVRGVTDPKFYQTHLDIGREALDTAVSHLQRDPRNIPAAIRGFTGLINLREMQQKMGSPLEDIPEELKPYLKALNDPHALSAARQKGIPQGTIQKVSEWANQFNPIEDQNTAPIPVVKGGKQVAQKPPKPSYPLSWQWKPGQSVADWIDEQHQIAVTQTGFYQKDAGTGQNVFHPPDASSPYFLPPPGAIPANIHLANQQIKDYGKKVASQLDNPLATDDGSLTINAKNAQVTVTGQAQLLNWSGAAGMSKADWIAQQQGMAVQHTGYYQYDANKGRYQFTPPDPLSGESLPPGALPANVYMAAQQQKLLGKEAAAQLGNPLAQDEGGGGGKGNMLSHIGGILTHLGYNLQSVGSAATNYTNAAIDEGSKYRIATLSLSGSGQTGTEGFFDFKNSHLWGGAGGGTGTINQQQRSMLPEYSLTQIAQGYKALTTSTNMQMSSAMQSPLNSMMGLAFLTGMDPMQVIQQMSALSTFSGGSGALGRTNNLVGMMTSMFGGNLSQQNVAPTLDALSSILPTLQGINPLAPNQSSQGMAIFQTALNAGMGPGNFNQVASVIGGLGQMGSNPNLQQQYLLSRLFPGQTTSNVELAQYQQESLGRTMDIAQLGLQQNIPGVGMSLPQLTIRISQAQVQMEQANLNLSGIQLGQEKASLGGQELQYQYGLASYNLNQAIQTQQYGPIGADVSKTAYFQFLRNQAAAGYNSTSPEAATRPTSAPVFGLKNEEFYAGMENQRQMLILQRSPLMADAAFQQQVKYIDQQEDFYKRELAITNEQRAFEKDWQLRLLDQQGVMVDWQKKIVTAQEGVYALQQKQFALEKDKAIYDQEQAKLQEKFLPEQVATLQNIQATLGQRLLGQGPVGGQNISPAQLLQQVADYTKGMSPGDTRNILNQMVPVADQSTLYNLIQQIQKSPMTLQQIQDKLSKQDEKDLQAQLKKYIDQGATNSGQVQATAQDVGLQAGGTGQDWKNLTTSVKIMADWMPKIAADLAPASPFLKALGTIADTIGPLAIAIGSLASTLALFLGKGGGIPGVGTGTGVGTGSTIGNILGWGTLGVVGVSAGVALGNHLNDRQDAAARDPKVAQQQAQQQMDWIQPILGWLGVKPSDATQNLARYGTYKPTQQQVEEYKKKNPHADDDPSIWAKIGGWWNSLWGGGQKPPVKQGSNTGVGGGGNPNTPQKVNIDSDPTKPLTTQDATLIKTQQILSQQSQKLQKDMWDQQQTISGQEQTLQKAGSAAMHGDSLFIFNQLGIIYNELTLIPAGLIDNGLKIDKTTTAVTQLNSDMRKVVSDTSNSIIDAMKGVGDDIQTLSDVLYKAPKPGDDQSKPGGIFGVISDWFKNITGQHGGSGQDVSSVGAPAGFITPHVNTQFHQMMNYGSVHMPHQGVDFAASQGTPLKEFMGGKVSGVGFKPWGGEIDVSTYGGLTERYLHLSQLDAHVGQNVSPGDYIGLTGGGTPQSGLGQWSSGSHLHAQIDRGDILHGLNPWPIWQIYGDTNLSQDIGGSLSSDHNGRKTHAFANGGVVTKPTFAEIGEAGEPEAVVPLSRLASVMQSVGGSSTGLSSSQRQVIVEKLIGTLNITIQGSGGSMGSGSGTCVVSPQERDDIMTEMISIIDEAITHVLGGK